MPHQHKNKDNTKIIEAERPLHYITVHLVFGNYLLLLHPDAKRLRMSHPGNWFVWPKTAAINTLPTFPTSFQFPNKTLSSTLCSNAIEIVPPKTMVLVEKYYKILFDDEKKIAYVQIPSE